jgi:hypothetical protein
VADDLLGVDRDVCLGRVEIEVAEQLRGDVDRQAAVDGFRGEDSAEVVGRESQRCPVDVDDAGLQGDIGDKFADAVGGDDLQPVLGGAPEQVRQRRAEDPLVAVVPLQQRDPSVGSFDAADDSGEHRDQVQVGGDDAFAVGLGRADLQQRHHLAGGRLALAQAQVGELK